MSVPSPLAVPVPARSTVHARGRVRVRERVVAVVAVHRVVAESSLEGTSSSAPPPTTVVALVPDNRVRPRAAEDVSSPDLALIMFGSRVAGERVAEVGAGYVLDLREAVGSLAGRRASCRDRRTTAVGALAVDHGIRASATLDRVVSVSAAEIVVLSPPDERIVAVTAPQRDPARSRGSGSPGLPGRSAVVAARSPSSTRAARASAFAIVTSGWPSSVRSSPAVPQRKVSAAVPPLTSRRVVPPPRSTAMSTAPNDPPARSMTSVWSTFVPGPPRRCDRRDRRGCRAGAGAAVHGDRVVGSRERDRLLGRGDVTRRTDLESARCGTAGGRRVRRRTASARSRGSQADQAARGGDRHRSPSRDLVSVPGPARGRPLRWGASGRCQAGEVGLRLDDERRGISGLPARIRDRVHAPGRDDEADRAVRTHCTRDVDLDPLAALRCRQHADRA